MTELKNLANHFLIAMPSMEDPFFSRSLTYICEHNEEGAMGLVVNQPTNMTLKELLEQADKDAEVDDEKDCLPKPATVQPPRKGSFQCRSSEENTF